MDLFLFFLAGLFISNGVPHYSNGMSGRKFHSPFAKPPGRGHSSALVNVVWALVNFAAGGAILYFRLNESTLVLANVVAFVLGIVAMSVLLAVTFQRYAEEQ